MYQLQRQTVYVCGHTINVYICISTVYTRLVGCNVTVNESKQPTTAFFGRYSAVVTVFRIIICTKRNWLLSVWNVVLLTAAWRCLPWQRTLSLNIYDIHRHFPCQNPKRCRNTQIGYKKVFSYCPTAPGKFTRLLHLERIILAVRQLFKGYILPDALLWIIIHIPALPSCCCKPQGLIIRSL